MKRHDRSRAILGLTAAALLLSLPPRPLFAQAADPPFVQRQQEESDRPLSTWATRATHPKAGSAARAPDDPEARPVAVYRAASRPAPVEDPSNLIFSIAGKLALVVLVIFACAAAWRIVQVALPHNPLHATPGVQVTSTISLAPQRFLHIVTVDQQRLLVASTPQNVALITPLEAEPGAGGMRSLNPVPPVVGHEPAPQQAGRFDDLMRRLAALEERTFAPAPRLTPGERLSQRAAIPLGSGDASGLFSSHLREHASAADSGGHGDAGGDAPSQSGGWMNGDGAPAAGSLFRITSSNGAREPDA